MLNICRPRHVFPAESVFGVVVHFPWLGPCFCSRSLPLAGALLSEQGGERAAGVVGGEQVAEVGEQRPVLQAASDRGRQGGFKWSSQRWLVEAIVDTR